MVFKSQAKDSIPLMLTSTAADYAPLLGAQSGADTGLDAALAELHRETSAATSREQALAAFRRQLARIQQQVRDEFETYRMAGVEAAHRLSALTDGVVRALFAHALDIAGPDLPDRMAIVATGGYGRGLLAPFSDIDLLFVAPEDADIRTLGVIEYMLYFMWDLGLKVGHATRSAAQCITEAERDLTIRTSLLDARPIAGDEAAAAALLVALDEAFGPERAASFITGKQTERSERHRRFGESAFLVEPNVKEGRGGLRDLQTLYWMVRAAYGRFTPSELAHGRVNLLDQQELRRLRRSWDFLWTVRFHMHYVSARVEDRLTFDLQPVVGARMGYTATAGKMGWSVLCATISSPRAMSCA